jgi:hypothetical protein
MRRPHQGCPSGSVGLRTQLGGADGTWHGAGTAHAERRSQTSPTSLRTDPKPDGWGTSLCSN